MLELLDILFYLIHLAIISFNTLGWIKRSWIKFHLVFAAATLLSWFLLGIWFGIGYCPVTDWHWQVKRALGEQDLPASFVKYFLDQLSGLNWNPVLVDYLTIIPFVMAIAISLYRWKSGK